MNRGGGRGDVKRETAPGREMPERADYPASEPDVPPTPAEPRPRSPVMADGLGPGHTLPTVPGPAEEETGAAAELPGMGAGMGALPTEIDRFEVIKLLGQGGMGRVYLARDRRLGRNVAIKEILEPNTIGRKRFRREAQAAARLQHQNIATIYDDGEFEGRPYIVTEYVRGTALATIDKPMPWQRVLTLGRAMTRGLAAAHRQGVIHRDIKPANIMVSDAMAPDDGEPKILDFGLARVLPMDDVESVAQGSAPDDLAGSSGSSGALTQNGAVAGTPAYMAPELWRPGPASKASDVYSLGVVLYELCAGHRPFGDLAFGELRAAVCSQDPPELTEIAPEVNERLAALIHRCLVRDPAQRYESGQALWHALEALAPVVSPAARAKTGEILDNPYPGLRPFDASLHRVFFGREPDVRELIERLHRERLIIVAGPSGAGKSSLVRAGVIPKLGQLGLADGRTWDAHTLVPGRNPVQALRAVLDAELESERTGDSLTDLLSDDAFAVSAAIEQKNGAGRGIAIIVDQLEELLTVSDESSTARFSQVLATLVERTESLRVIATVRGDKLTELMSLPGLGRLAATSFYMLRPIDSEGLRTAIVQPALLHGVEIEEGLVESLLAAGDGSAVSLPLLQFALSRLWEARDQRDQRGQVIRVDALERLGGVEGALSRHADRVWQRLAPDLQRAVRDVLIHLVAVEGHRARRSEDELIGGDQARRGALEALVESRLVTASRNDHGEATYELAHEALISGWQRLRSWLSEEGEILGIKERLAIAAADWEHEGRAEEYLWRGSRLLAAEAVVIEGLSPLQQEFLRASWQRDRRTRWARRILIFLPALMIVMAYGGFRYMDYRETREAVDAYLGQAAAPQARASEMLQRYTELRQSALDCFAADRKDACEPEWRQVNAMAPEIEGTLLTALRPLELALRRDTERVDVRRQLALAYHSRALLAQSHGREDDITKLVSQIERYDDSGEVAIAWRAPAPVTLETLPAGIDVTLNKYEKDEMGRLVPTQIATGQTGGRWELSAGSYLFLIHATKETAETRYPLWIPPGESRPITISIPLPLHEEIPPGFIYVPPGEFLFGYGADSNGNYGREWSLTLPIHKRSTPGFLIARHEATYEQWTEYLSSLSLKERSNNLPEAEWSENSVYLKSDGESYILEYRAVPLDSEIEAPKRVFSAGELVVYPERTRHRSQDWRKFPVTGVSGAQVQRYATWLSETGKVPGARLCREDEWERAARGADDRFFPHGNWLGPTDANYDETYGRKSGGYGFDEVGIHSASQSPFGLYDMAGNAFEMAISIVETNLLAMRGGSYYLGKITVSSVNRDRMGWEQTVPFTGFRLCADLPDRMREMK